MAILGVFQRIAIYIEALIISYLSLQYGNMAIKYTQKTFFII